MPVQLTDAERLRLRRIIRRPKSLKQFYRAKALLALDKGRDVQVVARALRIVPTRVASWADDFANSGLQSFPRTAHHKPRANSHRPTFEQDLDHVLEKNADLYKRLAE